jgi:hypothetical protein
MNQFLLIFSATPNKNQPSEPLPDKPAPASAALTISAALYRCLDGFVERFAPGATGSQYFDLHPLFFFFRMLQIYECP